MKLRGQDILLLRMVRPTTHEIGGTFFLNEEGFVNDLALAGGGKCRDAQGNLLPGVTNCSVTHPNGTVVFHTHPRANRPSSSDLAVAIDAWPVRKYNLIFSPNGVWVYAPTSNLIESVRRMEPDDRRRLVKAWRWSGHMFQQATQQGDCDGFCRFLATEGFRAHYIPYDTVQRDTVYPIPF